MKRGLRLGIDLFIEDGAYTTVAAAVTMLVTLTLLFSAITAAWTLSRSGEVQVAADATALAGSNVVASYRTAATVADAAVLSMGLAGLCTTGAGLVGHAWCRVRRPPRARPFRRGSACSSSETSWRPRRRAGSPRSSPRCRTWWPPMRRATCTAQGERAGLVHGHSARGPARFRIGVSGA